MGDFHEADLIPLRFPDDGGLADFEPPGGLVGAAGFGERGHDHVAFQFANTPIILTMPSTIGSKVSPVQSTSKVPRMSFKCFSLASR